MQFQVYTLWASRLGWYAYLCCSFFFLPHGVAVGLQEPPVYQSTGGPCWLVLMACWGAVSPPSPPKGHSVHTQPQTRAPASPGGRVRTSPASATKNHLPTTFCFPKDPSPLVSSQEGGLLSVISHRIPAQPREECPARTVWCFALTLPSERRKQ